MNRKTLPAEKPPIGVLPRWMAEERRLLEVAAAASRYLEVGRPVPLMWIEEIVDLVGRIQYWRAWSQRDQDQRLAAEKGEPRVERCVKCGKETSDWVDPDWAHGRICRDCERRTEYDPQNT